MKMMHGACFLACSNMSRTRQAPTPTNISTKSEPEMVKNGTLASPAIARASSVLPVPGRADHQHALGNLAAELLELAGILEEVDDLADLLLGLIHAGDVGEGDVDLILTEQARAALAEGHGTAAARPRPASGAAGRRTTSSSSSAGAICSSSWARKFGCFGGSPCTFDVGLHQVADQDGVVGLGVIGLELGLVLEHPADRGRPGARRCRSCRCADRCRSPNS